MCVREDDKDWDARVYQLQWGINNTFHKATKETPFFLLFNFASRNPTGSVLEDAVQKVFDEEVLKRREMAIDSIRAEQEKQRLRYNVRRAKAPTFEPGDLVVVERQPQASGESLKTAAKYRGPYVVTDKLKYDRYLVEDLPETQRKQKFYRNTAPVDKLKRFLIVDNTEEVSSAGSNDEEESDVREEQSFDEAKPLPSQSQMPTSETNGVITGSSSEEDDTRIRGARQRRRPAYLDNYV